MKRIVRLDFAALLGILLTIGVVTGAQWLGGGVLRTLAQGTAALVVFGGTAAALLVGYPIDTLRGAFVATAHAFVTPTVADERLVARFTRYAIRAKRRGLMSLEADIADAGDPFLARALELAVDGHEAGAVRRALEADSRTRERIDEASADVLEAAAGYAPTLGILGAVLGLIHVMENLAAPSTLGSGIAVAFVATVYGVGSANLILLPLATRVRAVARAAADAREIVIEGTAALQAGLHPRIVEQHLVAYVRAREQALTGEKAA